jgi:two-component system sensor histidine kinase UhpB
VRCRSMIPERLLEAVSLKLRILLMATAIMLAALGGGTVFLVHNARNAIASEVQSSMHLAKTLLTTAMAIRAQPGELDVTAIARALGDMRHVRVVTAPHQVAASALAAAVAGRREVPGWFERLMVPNAGGLEQLVVRVGAGEHAIAIIGDPHDELREIWDDVRIAAAFIVAGASVLLGLLYIAIHLGLRPLSRLLVAFEALGQGRFNSRVNERAAPELRRIHQGFNHVAAVLERMVDDNRHLTETLMSVQEDERRMLAHDLHDEMAPHLFCMRVALGAARDGEPSPLVREHLDAIDRDVVHLQSQVRQMLTRLRPHALESFGLEDALGELIASWRQRAPAIEWSLQMQEFDPALPEHVATDLYRVIQEGLTNVARHAGAQHARVSVLAARTGAADDVAALRVTIEDDGHGITADAPRGYGILGMRERVRRLGGHIQFETGTGGTRIHIELPDARADPDPASTP